MKVLGWLSSIAVVLAVSACGGGGGGAGTPPFGSGNGGGTGGTASTVAIDLLASSSQLDSGGGTVTITAVAKGPGNVSLPDTAIVFTADTGNLTVVEGTTNDEGVATATISAGSNKSNRTITVRATSGTATNAVQVVVTGTALAYSGDTTIPLSSTRALTVIATDSTGARIAGLPIAVASSLNNGLSSSALTTNSQGTATLNYTAANSGEDRLTFTGGGASTSATISISGENFVFVSPASGTSIPVGTSQAVVVRYLSNGAPAVGRTVNFAATAGTVTPTSGVTNASGEVTASVSSSSAAPATIQASLVGAVAQATLPVQFVATTPSRLVLQASPTAIGPNASGQTTQQAQLLATVTDANGNPVANQVVNFSRTLDPSGGNLSQASAATNASGQASVQYIAGALATSSNGVQLRATVSGTAVSGTASLTVNQSALFIALGTGNVIENIDPQTYKKDWVVYVTDSNGNAVPNVQLTIRALPRQYRKGVLAYFQGPPAGWDYSGVISTCLNEDTNYNGQLDAGEDTNGSGVLEPGNVIAVSPGRVTTDSTGRATVSVIYAESYVPWMQIALRAEAVVSGTESSREVVFWVDGLSSDFTNPVVAPAGETSPFGTGACSVPN
jgi:hypothetical protein